MLVWQAIVHFNLLLKKLNNLIITSYTLILIILNMVTKKCLIQCAYSDFLYLTQLTKFTNIIILMIIRTTAYITESETCNNLRDNISGLAFFNVLTMLITEILFDCMPRLKDGEYHASDKCKIWTAGLFNLFVFLISIIFEADHKIINMCEALWLENEYEIPVFFKMWDFIFIMYVIIISINILLILIFLIQYFREQRRNNVIIEPNYQPLPAEPMIEQIQMIEPIIQQVAEETP
jgi:hypothetical protein